MGLGRMRELRLCLWHYIHTYTARWLRVPNAGSLPLQVVLCTKYNMYRCIWNMRNVAGLRQT